MRFLVLILTILFSSTCFASNYPVIWTSDLNLKSLADIPSILASQKITEVNYTNNDNGQTAVAKTCSDYFRLTKSNYFPTNNMEIGQESYFKETCDPLRYLQHAQAAKISYIRNFDMQKDYKLLPAAVIFPSLGDAPDPKGDLATAFPDLKVKSTDSKDKNSIDITSQSAGMEANISVLGWGDFTHTNIDQMLIFVANYAIGGTFHTYTTYILTKNSVTTPIINIPTN